MRWRKSNKPCYDLEEAVRTFDLKLTRTAPENADYLRKRVIVVTTVACIEEGIEAVVTAESISMKKLLSEPEPYPRAWARMTFELDGLDPWWSEYYDKGGHTRRLFITWDYDGRGEPEDEFGDIRMDPAGNWQPQKLK